MPTSQAERQPLADPHDERLHGTSEPLGSFDRPPNASARGVDPANGDQTNGDQANVDPANSVSIEFGAVVRADSMAAVRFSVIIPTCDRPGQLAECLRQLARIDGPPGGFEIIVVDDGSSPPAVAPASVNLLRQPNRGPAAARNTGARAAVGSHLIFLDDDCRPARDWLTTLATACDRDPQGMIAGSHANGEPQNSLARFNHAHLEAIAEVTASSPHRFVITSNLCVPADQFRLLGGFDERFREAGGEDREFSARWLAAGYGISTTSALVTHHHAQDWKAFWAMHVRYGRGARRVGRPLPWRALLGATWRRTGIMGLMPYALSQLAIAKGYLERVEQRSDRSGLIDPRHLTVAIVSYNASETVVATLTSLRHQSIAGFEIMVVDSSSDGTDRIIREQFPEVRLVSFSQRLSPGAGRNIACEASERLIIAFLDADCIAEPDWVECILRAHAATPALSPHDDEDCHPVPWIIGGSVGTANPKSAIGWGYFFSEFSIWLPAGCARFMRDIPTCTLSLRRTAFERHGPFLESRFCSDTAFNWAACRDGHQPWFDPRIHVRHRNPEKLGRILAKQRGHGESFARLRSAQFRHSTSHNIARTLSAPLLPIYLWLRNGWLASRAPGYGWTYLKSSPFTLLALTAWSAGEAAGYWKAIWKSSDSKEAD